MVDRGLDELRLGDGVVGVKLEDRAGLLQ